VVVVAFSAAINRSNLQDWDGSWLTTIGRRGRLGGRMADLPPRGPRL